MFRFILELIQEGSDGLIVTILFGIDSLAACIIESENCSAHLFMSSCLTCYGTLHSRLYHTTKYVSETFYAQFYDVLNKVLWDNDTELDLG